MKCKTLFPMIVVIGAFLSLPFTAVAGPVPWSFEEYREYASCISDRDTNIDFISFTALHDIQVISRIWLWDEVYHSVINKSINLKLSNSC